MRYKIAAGILLLFGGIALVLTGVVFAGYAVYTAFVPLVGVPWAATIAAALFLVLPVTGLLVLALRARRAWPTALRLSGVPPTPDNVALAYLANLAKERPLGALLLSTLLGVAVAVLRKKG